MPEKFEKFVDKGESEEEIKQKPERLLKVHLIEDPEEIKELKAEGASSKEIYEKRQELLYEAPDFDSRLRKDLKEKGREISPNINLGLEAVEEFRQKTKEVQELRKAARNVDDSSERVKIVKLYNQKKEELKEYLDYGLSFEKAYREYLDAESRFFDFLRTQREFINLQKELNQPSIKSLDSKSELDKQSKLRLEHIFKGSSLKSSEEENVEDVIESLKTIYAEDSPEFERAKEEFMKSREEKEDFETKKDLKERVEELREKRVELWEDPMMRYFWQKQEIDKILIDFAEGKDVIENQSVIEKLNKINEWEEQHQRTTIGGVLVGPPGVGKTTLIRHYLEEKGRNYTYLDLSEDVTRYMLYGSKSIEFKSSAEYFSDLIKRFRGLDQEEFKKFVLENAENVSDIFGVKGDEAVVTFISQFKDELERSKKSEEMSKEQEKQVEELRNKIDGLSNKVFRKELGKEFAHLVKRNGWRDGVIISSLRRGDSIILDEFNKNKNWSLLFSLITSKPGEKWYFSDNDEWLDIPKDWRMYFTANIGRKHGGFEVAEALASRAGGKVMEVDYPKTREEMIVALASLSDPDGNFLRSKEDLSKLFVTVHELFPKVRKLIEGKRQTIPISYRTLRDIGEKLITYEDKETGQPVYEETSKNFDEVLYEVMVESYSVYEDKTVPEEIVNLATTMGLMLDDSVRNKIVKWVGEEQYKKRKKEFEEHKEDFQEVVKKIRGLSQESLMAKMNLPETREF